MTTNDTNNNDSNEMSTTTMMPIWISNDEIDPKWLQDKLNDPSIIAAKVKDISNDTRKGGSVGGGGGPKDGATLKVMITRRSSSEEGKNDDSKKPSTMIMKQTPPSIESSIQLSKSLGLAREALFYDKFGPTLLDAHIKIPQIYYSYGDYQEGLKCILMEDLGSDYIDSGILFGPGNPNNWNRDLSKRIQDAYGGTQKKVPPTAEEVTIETFKAIAKVHAKFWNDSTLLENNDWLRGSSWIKGKSKESWEASQGLIQGIYSKGIDTKIEWDPLVKSTVDHVMSNISWESQCARLNSKTNWTLVHGDFWPGNILISSADKTQLKMLDWEMVGTGSGPQDLGQYILSNMSVNERRECELRVVKTYFDELMACSGNGNAVPKNYTFEECFREYKIGGIERWLWFLVYFCGQESGSPLLKWAQFFHDQIRPFLHDHNLKPNDFIQPRP